jgi:CRP/FNR family transcriptional regulator
MRLEDFLSQNTQSRNFSKGDMVFAAGDQAEAAFCIESGRVEIFQGAGDDVSVLAVLGPGDIFGEMALLRFDEYTLSARATADTKAFVIAPELLQAQVRETPPLVRAILNALVDRIHGLNGLLIDIDKANKL